MVQIKKWVSEGITADELTTINLNITGSFKVGLSTTGGLAGALLNFVERNLLSMFISKPFTEKSLLALWS